MTTKAAVVYMGALPCWGWIVEGMFRERVNDYLINSSRHSFRGSCGCNCSSFFGFGCFRFRCCRFGGLSHCCSPPSTSSSPPVEFVENDLAQSSKFLAAQWSHTAADLNRQTLECGARGLRTESRCGQKFLCFSREWVDWKCRTWNCRTWKCRTWICKTWQISYENRLHYIRVYISFTF